MKPVKKSYLHMGGDKPLVGDTIPDYFSEIVSQFKENEAVVSMPQDRRLSYGDLSLEIDKLAKGLLALGFEKGDRIGIWSTNNIEWLVIQMATARIGAILVNINPAYRVNELAYVLKSSQLQGIFAIPSFRKSNYIEMLLEILPELKEKNNDDIKQGTFQEFDFLRFIAVYDPLQKDTFQRPASGFTLWDEIIKAGMSVSDDALNIRTKELDADDPINIQYTSGTTGFPKAVVLSHLNILNNAIFSGDVLKFTDKDRLCVPVPFYHCFGMVLANLLCLSKGACIVIACEHFDALKALQAVDKEKCTAIHGVPTMFIAELEHPEFKNYDMSSLRTGIMAGAPCAPELMNRVINEMSCREILIGYGQTEASPITHLTRPADSIKRRTETVGISLPYQEVKVIDLETGAVLPIDEEGEICFRGYHIMKEYYGDKEATQRAIDEKGWLHSGDIGAMDAEGYVKITGRLKEMIIRGGENIYPREIEDFLYTNHKIAEVSVFGVPDKFYGEEIVVWILLHENETATEEEIRNFCKDKIAHFKIPKYIKFVKEFPMTVTGKLQKFKMREMMINEKGD
ncbi:MAG: fatty acid CoA ligase family protein [Spirochaetia bacterium]|nr:fatty acid CoA ligase family protein [Spirochaetia bacterium]